MVKYQKLFFEELERKLFDNNVCTPLAIKKDEKSVTMVHCLKMCKELEYTLLENVEGCDAKWNLFVTAAVNYSDNKILLPHIPEFTSNVNEVLALINETPSLQVLRFKFLQKDYSCTNKLVIKLLHFVLIILNEPKLQKLQYFQFLALMGNVDQNYDVDVPTHVFKISSSTNSEEDELFEARSMTHGTKFGFYGCNLDNLYKILCDGFKSYITHKTDKKIYLNNEIDVILKNMIGTTCWRKSCCGQTVKVIAICEFINRDADIKSNFDKVLNCTHIIIDQPEIVRIRYLWYYCEQLPDNTIPITKYILENGIVFSIGCFVFVLFGTVTYVYKNNVTEFLMSANHKLNQLMFRTVMYFGL